MIRPEWLKCVTEKRRGKLFLRSLIMPKESLQKKVGRVRPPRVHITYDVEVGRAIEKRDLPFVVGVLADLSGMPEKPLPRWRSASSSKSTAIT